MDAHLNLLVFSILLASVWRSSKQAARDVKVRELYYVGSTRSRDNQSSFNQDLETSTNSISREKRLNKLG